MLVSEIMRVKGSGVLYTIPPQTPVLDCIKLMAEKDIGSLVVMEHGEMVGMLTFREVLQAIDKQAGKLDGLSTSAIMVRQPAITNPHMDVMELRRIMLEQHARYIPVLEGKMLIGVVSFHDVAKAVYEEASFENKMLKSYIKNWPDADSNN